MRPTASRRSATSRCRPTSPIFPTSTRTAPTGGLLSLQITNTSGNQTFDTFDTLNIYSWKGNGAAGMGATFDTLMTANGDEPDSVYGLLAQSVRVTPDKLDYRFRLRPEARFADGSKVMAADVAFSLNVLKDKGHPIYAQLLKEVESAAPEGDEIVHVRFVPNRSRDAHLIVVGMPVFSSAWWKGRDFTAATLDPPLGSGAYKVNAFEQGRFIEYGRNPNYWGAKLPVNLGQNNFDRLRFEYYRERQVAFEAFKAGAINFHEEYTSRFWATAYDFPAAKDGRVKKEVLHDGAPSRTQGWYLNTRREQFKDPRVREAIGLAFDFTWTNKNVMYSAYKRIVSYFPNSDMEAKGKPGPDELRLLEPFRDKLSASVFDDPYTPPESDGSGFDRKLLKQAYDLLIAAGCKRDGGAMLLPGGKPLTIEFLDFSSALQPHTMPFIQNLGKLGIQANLRIVDAAQYKSRTEAFDFDVVSAATGRIDDSGRRSQGGVHLAGCRPERIAQSRWDFRSRRRRAGRDDRLRQVARGSRRRLPGARSRAAGGALLGADVVPRHGLGRLLGRIRAPGATAPARRRRSRHLVVGRNQGQGDWALSGKPNRFLSCSRRRISRVFELPPPPRFAWSPSPIPLTLHGGGSGRGAFLPREAGEGDRPKDGGGGIRRPSNRAIVYRARQGV